MIGNEQCFFVSFRLLMQYNYTKKQMLDNLLLIAGSEATEVEDVDAALEVSTAFGVGAATETEGTIWSKRTKRHTC